MDIDSEKAYQAAIRAEFMRILRRTCRSADFFASCDRPPWLWSPAILFSSRFFRRFLRRNLRLSAVARPVSSSRSSSLSSEPASDPRSPISCSSLLVMDEVWSWYSSAFGGIVTSCGRGVREVIGGLVDGGSCFQDRVIEVVWVQRSETLQYWSHSTRG